MAQRDREITLRFLAQPTDVNFGGKVHGGSAMKWLDHAGYVCATAWSGQYCVTAFVGDINFLKPINVGELVQVDAKIIHTGRSSMHISVELYSSTITDSKPVRAIRCIMTFVAVDEDGHAAEVPSWTPDTVADENLQQYALRIMQLRKVNQQERDSL